jgi:2-polyprenyl-3-methyl-5-hydroxy-6-metoxy-1,4-benzoquinol methylase
MIEEVCCDLCGSDESLPLYTFRDVLYDLPGEFILRQCRRCTLLYLSPRPTPAAIHRYYPEDYSSYRPPVENEKWALMRWFRQRKLRQRRRFIERHAGQNRGYLLDVGCATGLFLNEMAQSGWQTAGIEPVASAAQFAQGHFGLDVFHGSLHEAPFEPGSFDVITFWDVLEHTFSPADELRRATALLRPGGLLALSLPNWHSFDRWLFGRHWHGFDPPRHLYVFSRQTLAAMLAQAGFSILEWRCFFPGYFFFIISLERWLKSVSPPTAVMAKRILALPGMRLPFEPWFTAVNWLGRGGIVSIFARKD